MQFVIEIVVNTVGDYLLPDGVVEVIAGVERRAPEFAAGRWVVDGSIEVTAELGDGSDVQIVRIAKAAADAEVFHPMCPAIGGFVEEGKPADGFCVAGRAAVSHGGIDVSIGGGVEVGDEIEIGVGAVVDVQAGGEVRHQNKICAVQSGSPNLPGGTDASQPGEKICAAHREAAQASDIGIGETVRYRVDQRPTRAIGGMVE